MFCGGGATWCVAVFRGGIKTKDRTQRNFARQKFPLPQIWQWNLRTPPISVSPATHWGVQLSFCTWQQANLRKATNTKSQKDCWPLDFCHLHFKSIHFMAKEELWKLKYLFHHAKKKKKKKKNLIFKKKILWKETKLILQHIYNSII
jgi:uncharacterized protein YjbI with pentapeptide repeats